MLLGRLGLETARIPHADRNGLVWLDRGRLKVSDDCLRFVIGGGVLKASTITGAPSTITNSGRLRPRLSRSPRKLDHAAEGSRPRPCCPAPKPCRCCSGPCWLPVRSKCARSTGGRPSTNRSSPCPLTSPPDQARIKPLGGRRRRISTTFETQPRSAERYRFSRGEFACAQTPLRRSSLGLTLSEIGGVVERCLKEASSQARGSTLFAVVSQLVDNGSPAHAGIDPICPPISDRNWASRHTR